MDRLYRDISVPVAGARVTDTVTVKGQIAPERETVGVKITDGRAEILTASAHDGYIDCTGKLYFGCICEDTESQLYSFSASADFTHKMECADAKEDAEPVITVQIMTIGADISDGKIDITAEADIFCRLEEMRTYHMLCEGAGTEVRDFTSSYMDREVVARSSSYVREDIVAGNVKNVIYADATANIRDITAVADTARIDGILNLNALCMTKDGGYMQLRQNIPFTMDAETKYDNCKNITGTVSVSDVRLRMTEDDYGLATVDAQIHAVLYSATQVPLRITTDAFSPSEPFSCVKTAVQMLLFRETAEQKTVARGIVRIPDMQEFSEAVFCTARPCITSASRTYDAVICEGLLSASMIYKDKAGNLKSVSDSIPYSFGIPTVYNNIEIDTLPIATAVNIGAVTDKGVEISVTLSVGADIYEICDNEIVTDTKPCKAPVVPTGFTVYFASSGDTVYDIAKSFCISTEGLKSANPDLGDNLKSGDRAVLINEV